MLDFIEFVLLLVQYVLSICVGYLLFLTVAAYFAPKHSQLAPKAHHNFLILIPAHNEQQLLPKLLKNLAELDYPPSLYHIHVVADNCTDDTAEIAKAHQVTVHERFNTEKKGKGPALQWLLQRLWNSNTPHDAILILDADSSVSANFVKVMDSHLAKGDNVIQAYYGVQNAESAWGTKIRNIALILLHYLRPQGRMVLGGSAGLKGNGMVFSAETMKNHQWSSSITEDIELHMKLLLSGVRVAFAPDAVVMAEMPDNLDASKTQNARWERGRLHSAKKFVPLLLKKIFSKHGYKNWFLYFDAVMEHIIPPFSILMGLSVLLWIGKILIGLLAHLTLGHSWAMSIVDPLSLFLIGGQLIYILAGLRLVNAPRSTYRALVFAPVYVIWKLWQILNILFGKNSGEWVRTARNRL